MGAAKKPKDWVEVWAAMDIPSEVGAQVVVLDPILRFGLEQAPESLGKIAAELIIGHRIKSKTLQEAVQAACKNEGTDKGFLRETFFLIFPKGPQSEWGWSRVGWSWQEWWNLLKAVTQAWIVPGPLMNCAGFWIRLRLRVQNPLSNRRKSGMRLD